MRVDCLFKKVVSAFLTYKFLSFKLKSVAHHKSQRTKQGKHPGDMQAVQLYYLSKRLNKANFAFCKQKICVFILFEN